MVTDMTSGRTFSVLLKFSLPMLLSVAFQQLYNIVDSVIAGNFVSDMALGAIGASYPVTMMQWQQAEASVRRSLLHDFSVQRTIHI